MMQSARLPLGLKLIVGFHVFSFVIWFLGQSVAVVAYDRVAGWGLQDSPDLIDPVILQINRAIGLTDTIVMLPLFIVAAVGLIRRRFYGAVASWLAFGMTLYWPVLAWCSQIFYAGAGIKHAPTSLAYVVVPGALLLFACWGSWYLGRHRKVFR